MSNINIEMLGGEGVSDLAMEMFDLHPVEHQQGQTEPSFLPKFCPMEFWYCGSFLLSVPPVSYRI